MRTIMLFMIFILLALLFGISFWAVINIGLAYYMQTQDMMPGTIFAILLLLNLIGLIVGVALSYWRFKKLELNIEYGTDKAKNWLQQISSLAAVILPFGV